MSKEIKHRAGVAAWGWEHLWGSSCSYVGTGGGLEGKREARCWDSLACSYYLGFVPAAVFKDLPRGRCGELLK